MCGTSMSGTNHSNSSRAGTACVAHPRTPGVGVPHGAGSHSWLVEPAGWAGAYPMGERKSSLSSRAVTASDLSVPSQGHHGVDTLHAEQWQAVRSSSTR